MALYTMVQMGKLEPKYWNISKAQNTEEHRIGEKTKKLKETLAIPNLLNPLKATENLITKLIVLSVIAGGSYYVIKKGLIKKVIRKVKK